MDWPASASVFLSPPSERVMRHPPLSSKQVVRSIKATITQFRSALYSRWTVQSHSRSAALNNISERVLGDVTGEGFGFGRAINGLVGDTFLPLIYARMYFAKVGVYSNFLSRLCFRDRLLGAPIPATHGDRIDLLGRCQRRLELDQRFAPFKHIGHITFTRCFAFRRAKIEPLLPLALFLELLEDHNVSVSSRTHE